MKASYTLSHTFHCSLERAFKTPILGDATQYLVGYGPVPPLLGFQDDSTWGQVGGHRTPIMTGNLFSREGPSGYDEILVREENVYWKWQVTKFDRLTLLFATAAVGEWWVEEIAENEVRVKWKYTWTPRNFLFWGTTWLFVKVIWRGLMKKGILGMKRYAEGDTGWLYQ